MKIKKISTNIAISLISIFAGIFICEVFARIIGLGNPVLYKKDSIIGYRLKPNQSKVRRKRSRITSDHEGFRIDHTKIETSNSKYLVFVGDSVTYGGSYIDNENLFSSQYCNLIGSNFYCLNNGVNSWGVLNMGRFISNFELYSNRIPEKFILTILPGDEKRNLRSLNDTPYWDYPPKQPSAINEIIRYLNTTYFIPSIKNIPKETNKIDKNKNDLQRKIIWKELENQIKDSKYKIDIVITPPLRWFKDESEQKNIKVYEQLLEKISKLENIKNTCNLYNYIKPNFDESFYVDGVHLSNKGHAVWSESIFSCLNRKN